MRAVASFLFLFNFLIFLVELMSFDSVSCGSGSEVILLVLVDV